MASTSVHWLPKIGQISFIGDGLTSDRSVSGPAGTRQNFAALSGGTRLYLASADGFGWFNNSGSFEVSMGVLSPNGPAPVSSPTTLGLTLAALELLGLGRRNPARRKGRAG